MVFTSLSGAGYGALAWLGVLFALDLLPRGGAFAMLAGGASLALIVAGLLASVFHLLHPERAWRALSQWRSSWLSREGVAALATFAPALAFLGVWIVLGADAAFLDILGIAAAAFALATMFCTAMIYRSLWTVPHWHNPWTVPCFFAIGLAGGALVLCASASLAAAGGLAGHMAALTAASLAVCVPLKARVWLAPADMGESSTATALGLEGRARAARPLEHPTTGETYVQREMAFAVARRHAARLRRIAFAAGIAAPLVLLGAALAVGAAAGAALAVLAAFSGLGGTLVERWLFFAEARHKAALYFGADRV